MSMKSIDPATGALLHEWPLHDDAEVERRLAAARSAHEAWRRRPYAERADLLRRAGDLMDERVDAMARRITAEMGKPIGEARAEVQKCATTCRWFAEHGPDMLAPTPIDIGDDGTAHVRHDPLGVVFGVMPWNFPLWQVVRFAAPTLMVGNTLVVKHAHTTQGCMADLEAVFADAGFPTGCVLSLRVDSDRVPSVIADPRIAVVTVTGSERAGSAVAEAAGKELKKSVLELGGSDPFVVLADADLDAAVAGAVKGRTLNSGQSCIAAKRFIVVDEIADAFVERFAAAMRELVVGDPTDDATDIGPMARQDLAEDLLDQCRRSVDAGAELVCGGGRPEGRTGAWVQPTVLDRVTPGMAAFDEETFGPLAAVVRAADADEALRLANASDYGLTSSVWTTDTAQADRFCVELEAGGVFVNAVPRSDPRVPFGGIGKSGYGRELGMAGLVELANQKTVWRA